MASPSLFRPLAVSLLLAAAASAQQLRVIAPIGAIGPPRSAEDDVGTTVEMFENPNLDRYLRRAQSFLEREQYDAAIQVLQDVIEGRTIEFVEGSGEQPEAGTSPGAAAKDPKTEKETKDAKADAAKAGTEKASGLRSTSSSAKPEAGKPADRPRATTALDAAKSVFSQDGRLYRPVRRLCHELLAKLPPVGIELYRTAYEVKANELFVQAQRDGSAAALEQVANRYFVTLPAGRAMVVLADRLMHEGRHRAAVQVLRDLVEVYPKENRKRLAISEVWCRFKIALCLRLAGEVAAAHAAVLELAAAHPDESLRILGELQSVKDLPATATFANEVIAVLADERRSKGAAWLTPATEALVPLWQYRFKNPEPYREPKATNNNEGIQIFGEGSRLTTMPHAGRHGPATWVGLSPSLSPQAGPHVLFLEHYRLRVADALTGNQVREADGLDEPPAPKENHPRVRIAASDFALLRPVEDEARRYVVLGYGRTGVAQNQEVLKASELRAYERISLERAWSSADWLDGEDGLRDVTFLAAPTIFGERLLLPALRRDAYSLECLERSTGRPLWHTALHAGGSPFFKAPGSPVAVHGGIAFVVTNAGCLAAVDAFAGDLRWIRRYERDDPLRPRPRKKGTSGEQIYGTQFVQNEILGFLPNDLVVSNGLVVMAPCDGNMLLCVDGATGKPQWMLDGATRYAPYGTLRMIVGATADDVFAVSDKSLVCIGLQGGLVRWASELPQWNGPKNTGRGRGTVAGGFVLLPGEREILAFDTAGKEPMRRFALPAFGTGRDPLAGSFNIVTSGPWLAIGYQGGVEMFSSEAALRQLAGNAADPMAEATFLVQAGAVEAAAKVLEAWLTKASPTVEPNGAELRGRAAVRLVALTRELMLPVARGGKVGEALAGLDRIRPLLDHRQARLNWHLARLEVCKEAGDLHSHELEQERLYNFMEGKG